MPPSPWAIDAAMAARRVAKAFEPVAGSPLGNDAVWDAFTRFANELLGTPAESSAPEPRPYPVTSELLADAAQLIHNLMSGRGVDRRGAWRWQNLVAELRDRSAAFKVFEDIKTPGLFTTLEGKLR